MLEVLSASFSLPFLLSFVFFFSPFFFLFNLCTLIGGQLLYSTVMIFAIHQYESATGIHVPLILNPPPTALSTPYPPGCHRAAALGSLASYVKLALIIYFNMYVSILCSHRKTLKNPFLIRVSVRMVTAQWFHAALQITESSFMLVIGICQEMRSLFQCWAIQ